jgi:predicted porin
MMKKTLIAMAALAATSAFAQSSVTMYGVVDVALQHQSNASPTGGSLNTLGSGAISGSRFGFKGNESLGGGLNALFQLESGFSPTTGALGQGGLMFGRQAYAGLSGAFGQVTMGRQYASMAEHTGNFDPLFGVSNVNESSFFLAYDPAYRQNNSFKYSNSIAGFTGSYMHGFGGVANASSVGAYNGLALSYTLGGLNVGAALQKKDVNVAAGGTAGSTKNSMIGANYGFGPVRAFFNFQKSNVADAASLTAASLGTSKVTTLGVNYEITPAINVLAAYYNDKTNLAAGSVSGSRNTFAAAVSYALSKRTSAYVYMDTSKEKAGYAAFAIPAGSDIFGAASTLTKRNNVLLGMRHGF